MQSARTTQWRPAAPKQAFCPGDRIRTLDRSRARLQLSNETYLALDQKTTVTFTGLKPQAPSWLDLLIGSVYLRSRTPASLDVRTPFVNALIKGTEFLVTNDGQAGQVSVFEGAVEAYNSHGRLTLTDGQTAFADAGMPPARKISLRPEDAVQWALYYPPILDLARLEQSPSSLVRRAVSRYLMGDLEGALSALRGVSEDSAQLLRVELLLSVGRVDEAEELLRRLAAREPIHAETVALQAVIALAGNDRETARLLADQAVSLDPDSAVPWTALSYIQQADFRLEEALESARQAAERDPGNALAQTRLAELYASLGRRSEAGAAAQRAIALSPRSARAHAVLGYVRLTEMDPIDAERSFHAAITIDASDPLSRFGLGLAKVRRGKLKEGTADLELAASLDPNDALFRSYLGKAYYDQRRGRVAETEFALAKILDPKDPTPWFYDAIKKQTENRPVEALNDLQKAIELNDNRAVYRSREMLDDDTAARSASLARIYTNLGFNQRALADGWKSLNDAPGNYSSHRFLADAYSNLRRHEIARTSELFQSQMLQPANMTPIQPQLAETDLFMLDNAGPALPSFNEFNPLFARNRFALQASAIYGSFDTFGDEAVHSGIWDQASYSLGQFHYETDGFRENNDLRHDIYTAFGQYQIAPSLSVQAEYRHRETESGDLRLRFEDVFSDNERNHIRRDLARVGLHWQIAPQHHLLASFIHQERDEDSQRFDAGLPCQFIPAPLCTIQDRIEFQSEAESNSGELAYLFHSDRVRVTFGGGYFDQSRTDRTQRVTTTTLFGTELEPLVQDDRTDLATEHGNVFLYNHIRIFDRLTGILGVSYDAFRRDDLDVDRVNPKLGLLWELGAQTLLRAAWFDYFKRPFASHRTLEPSQVAGFNQFFDDIDGTKSRRYGVGLDHRFTEGLFGGGELSWRDLKVPVQNSAGTVVREQNEQRHRVYLSWTPFDQLAISADYFYEATLDPVQEGTGLLRKSAIRTHRAPVSIKYFHPSGFFASFSPTFVDQQVTYDISGDKESDQFWLFDASLGYRLPNRYGIVALGCKNITDEKFHFEDTNLQTSDPVNPLYQPRRFFYARITLSY